VEFSGTHEISHDEFQAQHDIWSFGCIFIDFPERLSLPQNRSSQTNEQKNCGNESGSIGIRKESFQAGIDSQSSLSILIDTSLGNCIPGCIIAIYSDPILANEIRGPIDASRILLRIDGERSDNLLAYLRYRCISRDLKFNRKESMTKGTCQWIFNTKEFIHWRNQPNGVFWLSGSPGTGKSILTAEIIHRLEVEKSTGDYVVSYCADADYRRGNQPVTAILLDVLIQILARKAPGNFHNDILIVMKDLIRTGDRLSSSAIKYCVSKIRHHLGNGETLYVLLDGLDEIIDSPAVQTILYELLELAHQHDLNHKIKCFISTRPTFLPVHIAQAAVKVDLNASILIRKDVYEYVQDRLRKGKLLNETWDSRDMTEDLITQAKGIFLWARLVVDKFLHSIGYQPFLRPTRQALTSMPELDLNILYGHMVDQVTDNHHDAVFSMLRWVTYAARPLHVQELHAAMQIQIGSELPCADIINVSAGLLVIDGSDTVRLTHSTVREYLQFRMKENWEEVSLEAHESIAYTCLKTLHAEALLQSLHLLLVNLPEKGDSDSRQQALVSYAQQNWIFHYQIAEGRSGYLAGCLYGLLKSSLEQQEIATKEAQSQCSNSTDKYASWGLPHHGRLMPLDILNTALAVGSRHGFRKLVNLVLDMGADVNYNSGPERLTPLCWASRFGHLSIAEMLIQYGANLYLASSSGNTPLVYATAAGHVHIVDRLLHFERQAAKKSTVLDSAEELSLITLFSEPCNTCGAVDVDYEVRVMMKGSSRSRPRRQ
jgi:hypothetical protein